MPDLPSFVWLRGGGRSRGEPASICCLLNDQPIESRKALDEALDACLSLLGEGSVQSAGILVDISESGERRVFHVFRQPSDFGIAIAMILRATRCACWSLDRLCRSRLMLVTESGVRGLAKMYFEYEKLKQ